MEHLAPPPHSDRAGGRSLRRRVAVAAALGAALAYSTLRAMFGPNDWAEAHWLITYEVGFVKRGLPGQVLDILAGSTSDPERLIGVVATTISIALLIAFAWVAQRILRRQPAVWPAVLVFFTSPGVVLLANLNGYYDYLVLGAGLVACGAALSGRTVLAGMILGVSVLVHETTLVLALLPALFAVMLRNSSRDTDAETVRGILATAVPPALVFLALVVASALLVDQTELQSQLATRLGDYSFVEDHKLLEVSVALTTSFTEYLAVESPQFWSRLSHPFGRQVLMALGAMSIVAAGLLRNRRHRLRLGSAYLALCLAPLALHAIAWDVPRIWIYPLLNAFLGLWLLAETSPPAGALRIPSWLTALSLTLVVHQAHKRVWLMIGSERFPRGEREWVAVGVAVLALVWLVAELANRARTNDQSVR